MLPWRCLLTLGLACAILLNPWIVAAQSADSQQPNNSRVASPILKRVQVRYEGSFDWSDCQNVYAELQKRGVLPKVESRYDPQKIDSAKKALQDMWKERGVTVRVRTTLERIANMRAVMLDFVVSK
jgi:hypothetical protein